MTPIELRALNLKNNEWFRSRPDPRPCPKCDRPSVLVAQGSDECLRCIMGWTADDFGIPERAPHWEQP